MAHLIDTHIWIWWLSGSPSLSKKERDALDALDEPPWLAAISLWEVSILHESKRIDLLPDPSTWLKRATSPDLVQIIDLSPSISLKLFSKEFEKLHRDPADRIIVATANALHIPLQTHDQQIMRSGLVKIWEP